jgi:hypothetical protein
MDEIRFEIGERDDPAHGMVEAVVIFVNDRDLTGIAREVELPFAARDGRPELAGDYAGLPPEAVFLPSQRLLGRPEERYNDRSDKISILGCGCGVVGCWPLRVKITPSEDTVLWDDFEQPHRRHWRHEALGPFVFDRAQYTSALGRGSDLMTF